MIVFAAELRWWLMLACLVIFVLAFGAMLISAWHKHRKVEDGAENFHGSLAVEMSWSLAPLLIVMVLVWPTVRSVLSF